MLGLTRPQARDEEEEDRQRAAWDGLDEPETTEKVAFDKPGIRFRDVGGMNEVKEDIRLKIIHMWIGNSEKNLHALFEQARFHQPCVLFFDEVDAPGASRADMRRTGGRHLINQLLAELDGVHASNEGVLILAATNAPWHLDSAFKRPGRVDRGIFVPLPDEEAQAHFREALRLELGDDFARSGMITALNGRHFLFRVGGTLTGRYQRYSRAHLPPHHRPRVGGTLTNSYLAPWPTPSAHHRPRVGGTLTGSYSATRARISPLTSDPVSVER